MDFIWVGKKTPVKHKKNTIPFLENLRAAWWCCSTFIKFFPSFQRTPYVKKLQQQNERLLQPKLGLLDLHLLVSGSLVSPSEEDTKNAGEYRGTFVKEWLNVS